MKNLMLTLILLSLLVATSKSQSCLPNGILFSTQGSIDSFQINYPGCMEIEGNVEISGEDITNLNGLNVLFSIQGMLKLNGNSELTSVSGLENLSNLGSLIIWENDKLASLSALENLYSIDGDLRISYSDSLHSLNGMENLIHIGGNVRFEDYSALVNLSSLDNLATIGGFLAFDDCEALTDLTGLENLTSIGGYLSFSDNHALISVEALQNLNFIGGVISFNDNDAITNLSGLDNIDPESIEGLYFSDNLSLSFCEVQSICQFLTNPTDIVTIQHNGQGCDSDNEIIEACSIVGTTNRVIENQINIYPNPASKFVTIIEKSGKSFENIKLFNQTGQLIQEINSVNHMIDISFLPKGIYFVEFDFNNKLIHEKLIIQ